MDEQHISIVLVSDIDVCFPQCLESTIICILVTVMARRQEDNLSVARPLD